MELYLPVAEMSVNWLLLIALGTGVGFLSGMFGVGGGFLMTPLLVFTGIPSTVAVATTLSHVTASSMSGALAQWRKRAIDFTMDIKKQEDPKGDRVVITMSGKFLPYKTY